MSSKEEWGEGNGGVMRYQVKQNSVRLDRLEDWRTRVDEDRTMVRGELKNLHDDIVKLNAAVEGTRRVLIGFAFSIAGSTIVFALSILLATGKL
jgi:hypothetical protein